MHRRKQKQKQQQFDVLKKIIIIGDSGVGKSNILLRYSQGKFVDNYMMTIGINFMYKVAIIEKIRIKMQIWDTAGQDKYKTITKNYYKDCSGAFVVFSINSKDSFQSIRNWIDDLSQYAPQTIKFILVGNKMDLLNERQVERVQAQQFAKQYNIQYMQCSAKSGQSIQEAFYQLGKMMIKGKGEVQQIEQLTKSEQKIGNFQISNINLNNPGISITMLSNLILQFAYLAQNFIIGITAYIDSKEQLYREQQQDRILQMELKSENFFIFNLIQYQHTYNDIVYLILYIFIKEYYILHCIIQYCKLYGLVYFYANFQLILFKLIIQQIVNKEIYSKKKIQFSSLIQKLITNKIDQEKVQLVIFQQYKIKQHKNIKKKITQTNYINLFYYRDKYKKMSLISLGNITTLYIISTFILFMYTFHSIYTFSSNYFSAILIYMDTTITNFIFYNLIFSLAILCYKFTVWVFFVQLKENQTLKMVDKLKAKILDVFLFCYILQGEIQINSFICIVFIFFAFIIHEMIVLRADYLTNTPVTLSLGLNYRLTVLMLIVFFVDYEILKNSYAMLYSQKSTYFIFVYYIIIMFAGLIFPMIKYFVDFYEKYTLSHVNCKDQRMALANLLVSVPRLLIQILLAIGLAVKFNIFFYLIFTVIQLISELSGTIKSYNRIKKLTDTMKNLKHIDEQEIKKHHDATCMVCFQEMTDATLLPCKHFFHDDCLKQWILKNSNHFCPKCKKGFDFEQKKQQNEKQQNQNNMNNNANNLNNFPNNQRRQQLRQRNRVRHQKYNHKKQKIDKQIKRIKQRRRNYTKQQSNTNMNIQDQQKQQQRLQRTQQMRRQLNEEQQILSKKMINQNNRYRNKKQQTNLQQLQQFVHKFDKRQSNKHEQYSTLDILQWTTPRQLVEQNSFDYLQLGSIAYGLPTQAVYRRTTRHMHVREKLVKDFGLKDHQFLLLMNGV